MDFELRENRIKEIKAQCTLKSVFLVADIMKERMIGKCIDSLFSKLYRECFALSILSDWSIETEEEKADEREFLEEKRSERLIVYEGKECMASAAALCKAWNHDCEDSDPIVNRFIEIIQTPPKNITDEMMIEAVDLFPNAIKELGEFY
jgi:hypothetical protein